MAQDSNVHLLTEEALNGDWAVLSDRIANAIIEITKLSSAAKEITFNIQGSDSFLNFIAKMNSSENDIKNINVALNEIKETTQTLGLATEKYGQKLTALLPTYADLKAQININNEQIRIYSQGIKTAEESLNKFGTAILNNEKFANEYNARIKENQVNIAKLQAQNSSLAAQLSIVASIEKDLISTEIKLARSTSDSNQSLVEKKLTLRQVSNELLLNAQMQQEAFEKEVQIRVNKRILNQEISREVRNQTGEYDAALKKQIEAEESAQLKDEQRTERMLLNAQRREVAQVESATKQAEAEEAKAAKIDDANNSEIIANKNLEGSILKVQLAQDEVTASAAQYNVVAQQQIKINKLNAEFGLAETDSYASMSAEYRLLDIEVKKYTLAQIKSGEVDRVLIQRHRQLSLALKEYDSLLGVNTRRVGDYKSANEALTNTRQKMVSILLKGNVATEQELIRYKELEAEALRLAAAQREVNESTKVGATLIEQFGSMFTRQTLRMVGSLILWQVVIGAFSSLYDWFTKLTDAEQRAKDRLDEYTSSLKNLSEELNNLPANIKSKNTFDISKIASLTSYIENTKNVKDNIEGVYNAYKKLQSIAPDLLDELDKDSFKREVNSKKMIEQFNNLKKYKELQNDIDTKREVQQKTIAIRDKTQQEIGDKISERNANRVVIGRTSQNAPYYPYFQGKDERFRQELIALSNQKNELDEKVNEQDKYLSNQDAILQSMTGKTKDKKDAKPKSDYEIKKRDIEADYELRKKQLEGIKETQKAITDDESKEQNERIRANQIYQATLIEISANEFEKVRRISDLDVEYKKEKQKTADKNKRAALEEYYNEYNNISRGGLQKNAEIIAQSNEQWVKGQELSFAEQKNIEMQGYLIQEQVLQDMLDNKFIKQKEYNKKIDELKNKELILANEVEQEFDRKLLNSGNLTDGERKKYENRVAELEKQLASLKAGKKKVKNNEETNLTDPIVDLLANGNLDEGQLLKAKKEFWQRSVELAQASYDAINTIRNNAFEQEQIQIGLKQRQTEILAEQQIAAIDASVGYAIQKDDAKAKVEAQTAAREATLQQQSNQLALKQAKANKQAAEGKILVDTAAAIVGVFKAYSGIPGGIVVAAGLAAVIAGIGAVEFAAAASAPLPQFWMGGKTETPMFSAGEKGIEIITPADGKPSYFTTSTPSIYHEKPGAIVTSNDKTMKMIEYAVGNVMVGGMKINSEGNLIKEVGKEVAKILGNKIEESNQELAYVIVRSRPSAPNIYIDRSIDHLTYKIQTQSRKR